MAAEVAILSPGKWTPTSDSSMHEGSTSLRDGRVRHIARDMKAGPWIPTVSTSARLRATCSTYASASARPASAPGSSAGACETCSLGRPASDWDVATDARPKELLRIFPRAIPTGIEHGTVTVLAGGASYEVTTLRGDGSYSDGRRPDWVEFVDDITADLARRDFTVNAIAVDPVDGELIDPFDGRRDLKRRRASRRRRSPGALHRGRAARPSRGPVRRDARAHARPRDGERHRPHARHVPQGRRRARARRVDQDDEGAPAVARVRGHAANGHPRRHVPRAPRGRRAWSRTSGTPTTSGATAWSAWTPARATRCCASRPCCTTSASRARGPGPTTTQDYTFYDHDRVGAEIAEPIAARLRFSNDETRAHRRARSAPLVSLLELDGRRRASLDSSRRPRARRGPVRAQRGRRARQGARPRGRPRRAWPQLKAHVARVLAEGAALSTRDLKIDGRDLMRELGLRPGRIIGRDSRGSARGGDQRSWPERARGAHRSRAHAGRRAARSTQEVTKRRLVLASPVVRRLVFSAAWLALATGRPWPPRS